MYLNKGSQIEGDEDYIPQQWRTICDPKEIENLLSHACWERFAEMTKIEKGLNEVSAEHLINRARAHRTFLLAEGTGNIVGCQSRLSMFNKEVGDQLHKIFYPGEESSSIFPDIDIDMWATAIVMDGYRQKGGNTLLKIEMDRILDSERLESGNDKLLLKIGDVRDLRSLRLHTKQMNMEIAPAHELPFLKVFMQYAPYPVGQGLRQPKGLPFRWADEEAIAGLLDRLAEGVIAEPFPIDTVLLVSNLELAHEFDRTIYNAMSQVSKAKRVELRDIFKQAFISGIFQEFQWTLDPDQLVNLIIFAGGLMELSARYNLKDKLS